MGIMTGPNYISHKKLIGCGAFGDVYRVSVRTTADNRKCSKCALKVTIEYHDLEPEAMQRLNHSNVINLIHHFKRKGRMNLLYELMEDCDLQRFIRHHYSTDNQAKLLQQSAAIKKKVPDGGFVGLGLLGEVFAFQLFRGLSYLASQRIVHLDIKSENLLVSKSKGTLKIGDFG